MPVYVVKANGRNYPFVHAHIPKTGGVAISHYFSSRLGAQVYFGYEMNPIRPMLRCHPHHYHYEMLNNLFLLEKAACSFTIVRHPVSRMQSDYIWAMSKSEMRRTWMSFDEWVPYVLGEYEKDSYFLGNHIRPQHEFVGPLIGNVYRFEDGLDAAIEAAMKIAGLEVSGGVSLSKINTRNDTGVDARLSVEMKHDTRRKIMNFYETDLRQFSYS